MLDEFKDALKKYVEWKPAEKKDLASKVITEEKAAELVEELNEFKREKKVFEDFEFDHEDVADIRKREEKALALIAAGQMPVEKIDGDVQINITEAVNLPTVPNMPYLVVMLKRIEYADDGSRTKANPLIKLCKKFNR